MFNYRWVDWCSIIVYIGGWIGVRFDYRWVDYCSIIGGWIGVRL